MLWASSDASSYFPVIFCPPGCVSDPASTLCPGPELQPPASTLTACSSCYQSAETCSPSSVGPSRYHQNSNYPSSLSCVCVCDWTCYLLLLLLLQCCSRTAARQLDRNITFHKLVAYMIAFHTGRKHHGQQFWGLNIREEGREARTRPRKVLNTPKCCFTASNLFLFYELQTLVTDDLPVVPSCSRAHRCTLV